MSAVELRLVCAECGAASDAGAEGWRAFLTCDEPAEAAVFCPDCAELEFGD
jgi:hypothetical protein